MRQRRSCPVYGYMRRFLVLCLLGLLGCTPSPSERCKRLETLGAKDPAGFKLSMEKCVARMTEMRERDPDAYKCAARTVARLTTIDTALLAVSVCDSARR